MIERLFQELARGSDSQPSDGNDRFVRRCLASDNRDVTRAAVIHTPISDPLRAELCDNATGDVELARMICLRSDATAADVARFADILSDDDIDHIGAYTRSEAVRAHGLDAAVAGDLPWAGTVTNYHVDIEALAAALSARPELCARYRGGQPLTARHARVLEVASDDAAVELIATGSIELHNQSIDALVARFKLADPDGYRGARDVERACAVIDGIIEIRRRSTAPAAMAQVLAVLEASVGHANETVVALQHWIRDRGVEVVGPDTSERELGDYITSCADPERLEALLAFARRRVDESEPIGRPSLIAVWNHPRRDNPAVRRVLDEHFAQLDAGANRATLVEIASTETNPIRFCEQLGILGGDHSTKTTKALVEASPLEVGVLAATTHDLLDAARADGGDTMVTRYSSLVTTFAVTWMSPATLEHVPMASLTSVASRVPMIDALDELLGRTDDAWAAFNVFGADTDKTVGEVAELCRLTLATPIGATR